MQDPSKILQDAEEDPINMVRISAIWDPVQSYRILQDPRKSCRILR